MDVGAFVLDQKHHNTSRPMGLPYPTAAAAGRIGVRRSRRC